jgi:VIT1/CCC1 family predicted Fe2+/Mn2+ transporter
VEAKEITEVFQSYGINSEESAPVVEALRRNRQAWVNFMMRFELGLETPEPQRARNSALTIGGAYIAGGFIPLLPYLLLGKLDVALRFSVVVTLLALLIFGFVKGRFTGVSPLRTALQTVVIGGLAATAAFLIARAIG